MTTIDPPVKLSGTTKPYEGYGRKFGYPTANIQVSTDLEQGVYFGFADLGQYKQHPALIFIGVPITVGASAHRVEAHLLDIADNNYYSESLQLTVHHFHRANQHFSSIPELTTAMKTDESVARAWFQENRAQTPL